MKRTEILKYFVNILAVVLTGAIAFLFVAYGLHFKNINFIAVHFTLLLSVSAVAIGIITLAGVLFFVFERQSLYRLILCLLIFLDIFTLIFYALCATGLLGKINSVDALRAYISTAGSWTAVIFVVFCFLQVVLLPVPGSVAVAVGVAMFGPLKCAIFAFIGIVIGSIVAFAIGRWIGYKAVCWIVGKDSLDKWLEKIKGKDYLILSLMFLLPMFPDDVLCFIAGLSSMGWLYFIVMIIITRAISVFSTAYSFEIIPFTTWWGILIWVMLALLVALSFWLVYKYSDKIDAYIKSKFKVTKNKR